MSGTELDFGDYVRIAQKRYGAPNEMYVHKVIRALDSNTYVNVPVDGANHSRKEIAHDEIVPVVACICCGVVETEVRKYRVSDVLPCKSHVDATTSDLIKAAERFVWKVENGLASSTESYGQFKDALAKIRELEAQEAK